MNEAFYIFENKLIVKIGFVKVDEIGRDKLWNWFNQNKGNYRTLEELRDAFLRTQEYEKLFLGK